MTEARIEVRFAWWVRYYLAGLLLFAWLTGGTPDWEKVRRVLTRGLRLRCG